MSAPTGKRASVAADPGRRPIEVAIVGGGCAAITTAFELSRRRHRGRFRVTVYQQGWRLGGKGASGRGPADRIEEHGLHVWHGFYENAFRITRECYAELGRDPTRCRFARWRDAFVPAPFAGLAERLPDGRWRPWLIEYPDDDELPGEPAGALRPLGVGDYLLRAAALARALLRALERLERGTPPAWPGDGRRATTPARELVARATRLVRYGRLLTMVETVEALRLFEALLRLPSGVDDPLPLRLLDRVAAVVRRRLEERLHESARRDERSRQIWRLLELTFALSRGILASGLLTHPRGFDAVDELDFRVWLARHGASREALDAPLVRILYDLCFAYENGDPARPRLSAASALRGLVRMLLSYRGAFFWRMRGSLGDVFFAPLYQVLRRRGVRFEFFHRLENVALGDPAAGGAHVAALDFDVQAEIAGGGGYRPLVDVRGLPCWPSSPDWEQLVDGERLAREGRKFECHWDRRRVRRRRLRLGRDFDFVVLGVSVGAVPHVCRELVTSDRRWRAMVEHMGTVATGAFQIWLRADMAELGWRGPPINLGGFADPFNAWAEMSHLRHEESWPETPRAIAYFCGSIHTPGGVPGRDDTEYPARAERRVHADAIRFLERDLPHLWPRCVRPGGGFPWRLLIDPQTVPGAAGPERFDSQFWTANVSPSDHYVQALPGTARHRISPLDRTYDNLTVCGDWTDCGFNLGSIEAAVMSGRLAAHALSLSPPLAEIPGYDHP